jgi:hypothetical protein
MAFFLLEQGAKILERLNVGKSERSGVHRCGVGVHPIPRVFCEKRLQPVGNKGREPRKREEREMKRRQVAESASFPGKRKI